jgi:hypothetical protein
MIIAIESTYIIAAKKLLKYTAIERGVRRAESAIAASFSNTRSREILYYWVYLSNFIKVRRSRHIPIKGSFFKSALGNAEVDSSLCL